MDIHTIYRAVLPHFRAKRIERFLRTFEITPETTILDVGGCPWLWIQTPARSFFFEPHFPAPFFHWLPVPVRKRVARRFTLWGLIPSPSSPPLFPGLSPFSPFRPASRSSDLLRQIE